MAQRNEVRGALARRNGRHAGHEEHVALARTAVADQRQRGRLHHDASFRPRHAMRDVFASHVHHHRLPGGIEVGKMRGVRRRHGGGPAGIRTGLRFRRA